MNTVEYHNFEELIDIAASNHNIPFSGDLDEGLDILKTHPYYTIVNGYQRALEDEENSEKFKTGVSLQLLGTIHTYETIISSDLLRIILAFETKLKNILQDTVSRNFGISESLYLNADNYRNSAYNNNIQFFNKLTNIATDRDKVNGATKKYRASGNVPPWILVNELTFGQLRTWYLLLPVHLKPAIFREFVPKSMDDNMAIEFFTQSLSALNDYRNGLAHGDVLNKIHVKTTVHLKQIRHVFDPSVVTDEEFNSQNIGKGDVYGLILLLFILAPLEYQPILHAQLIQNLTSFNDLIKLDSPEARKLLAIPDNILKRIDLIHDMAKEYHLKTK